MPRLEPPVPVVWYERDRPDELLRLDTKKLARIEAVGHRIDGHRSRKVDRTGSEFLHVCVGDATRVAHIEVWPDEKGTTAAGFRRRACRKAPDHWAYWNRVRLDSTEPKRPVDNAQGEAYRGTLR